jgi:hypothetical protein
MRREKTDILAIALTASQSLYKHLWIKAAIRRYNSSKTGIVPHSPGSNLLDASAGRLSALRTPFRHEQHTLSIHG